MSSDDFTGAEPVSSPRTVPNLLFEHQKVLGPEPQTSPAPWAPDHPAGVEHRPVSGARTHAEVRTDLRQGEPCS
jgi:hypothetical protein